MYRPIDDFIQASKMSRKLIIFSCRCSDNDKFYFFLGGEGVFPTNMITFCHLKPGNWLRNSDFKLVRDRNNNSTGQGSKVT